MMLLLSDVHPLYPQSMQILHPSTNTRLFLQVGAKAFLGNLFAYRRIVCYCLRGHLESQGVIHLERMYGLSMFLVIKR